MGTSTGSPRFEWVGGALPLDFVNTVTWDPEGLRNERLDQPGRVVEWAVQAGIIGSGEADRLESAGNGDVLARVHRLRWVLHEVLTATARGEASSSPASREFRLALAQALGRLTAEPEGGGWRWTWGRAWPSGAEELLYPVVWSAARVLTTESAALKPCAARACGWLFLDRSRNRSRRWCDMRVCGNNAKARRYYHRHRGLGAA
jgi:predicted RNA-binding Zn ribbon-like protein